MVQPYPIFPTSYFPPISLMAALVRQEKILFEGQETFPKQTLRNRTVIVTADGTMTLSVPIMRPNGNHTNTSEIRISYSEPWNRNHWRAILTAYNASPYFLYYRDEIEQLLNQHYDRLIELNESILRFLWRKLKLPLSIDYTTAYNKAATKVYDPRFCFDYKHPANLPALPEYTQVFSDRLPFNGNVSILDLLFNLGPESLSYLKSVKVEL